MMADSKGVGDIGADKSATLAAKEKQQNPATTPNDLGLFLGTLVMPAPHKRPGFVAEPVRRVRIEAQRVWRRIQDFFSVLTVKYMSSKPRLKLRLLHNATTAKDLHSRMYTAFAAGDTNTLSEICAEGLRSDLRARVASRPAGQKRYAWTLHSYVGRPRVVSHRATTMPVDDHKKRKSGLRQVVVRIASRQSLRALGDVGAGETAGAGGAGMGAAAGGTQVADGRVRDVVEYVVIQRRMWKGSEEPWLVWGTTQETSMEAWDATINPVFPRVGNASAAV